MPRPEFEAAVRRATVRRHRALAEDLLRLRGDAGVSRRRLALEGGVDRRYLDRIEGGGERPSLETYQRLAAALGADLSTRLDPATGPAIRDRHQAAILELLLGVLDARWHPFAEVAVRHPSRGWIDAALHDPIARLIVASELQSGFQRLEQLVHWSAAKADALPSWEGWAQLGDTPEVSRLLIVRRTRATRAIAAEYSRQLRLAYPAHPDDALAALAGPAS